MDRVLILVDDEPNMLSALQRVFRREGYLVLTGNSAEEGLALLASHPVAVVISDQRMPAMNGAEFLSIAKARHPDTIRIILSGYTELGSVFDAINRGAVYKFLTKPWDDDLLRAQVADAFDQLALRWQNRQLLAEIQTQNQTLAALNARLTDSAAESRHTAELSSASLSHTQSLLDALPVGLMGIDPQGLIVYSNPALRGWLKTTDGLTGLTLHDLPLQPVATQLDVALAQRGDVNVRVFLPTGCFWLKTCWVDAQSSDAHLMACFYPTAPETV